jgi:phage terminase large subunit GpA-like protein
MGYPNELRRAVLALRQAVAPPPRLTVSQWADAHRRLSSESAAEPGQWRTDRAPFQRGIMDAVTDPRVREVVVMKSAQVGWTEILGNVVGYHIDRDPAAILLIQPTLDMAEAWSKDRLAPMVRDTPALRGKIKDARSRDSGNTLLHKQFPGGHITMAGANSPASLASRPIRVVLCDEVDRYPASAGTEGDPISLARKRSTTFWNRKLLMGSTPTVKGESRIESAFETSDRRYFEVPCPHCETFDRLRWDNVKWPEQDPRAAYYACPECGGVITDADKTRMLQHGRWTASAESDGVAGFHIWEAYSPWVTFGQMAAAFVEAKRTPQTLQTWVNTSLGETWVEQGDAPTWERVLKQRADYQSGEVPAGVLALVSGVDVQKNRLVYVVRGFGLEMFSALVEHGELFGDTDQPEVWTRLANLLAERWGPDMPIAAMMVDSGYRTDQVYAFARRFPQVRATKGHDTLSAPIKPAKVDVTVRGQVVKQGLKIWHVDSSYFKGWIHVRIEWPVGEPGAWLLPQDVSDEYCKQVAAESRITLPNGKRVWKKVAPDNHYLDAEVLATAAAQMLQIHRMRPGPGAVPRAGRRVISKGLSDG